MNAWWKKYIGLPFRDHGRDPAKHGGLDCWGLVRWVYAQELGVVLPSYIDEVDERATLAMQIKRLAPVFLAGTVSWQMVPKDQHKAFDVVLLRRGNYACHVGVVTRPGTMLHVERGINAMLEEYSWGNCSTRVVGVYRHA